MVFLPWNAKHFSPAPHFKSFYSVSVRLLQSHPSTPYWNTAHTIDFMTFVAVFIWVHKNTGHFVSWEDPILDVGHNPEIRDVLGNTRRLASLCLSICPQALYTMLGWICLPCHALQICLLIWCFTVAVGSLRHPKDLQWFLEHLLKFRLTTSTYS